MSTVSVILPTHNTPPAYLRAAIDSALAQTYRPLEILVVDDGSTDSLDWLAAGYGDRIRYVRQSNGGPSVARNTGMRRARGTYVAFLDADDVWEPEKLARQVLVLEANPAAAMVYARMRKIDGDGRPVSSRSEPPTPAGRIFWRLIKRDVIPMSSVVARREALQAVGGFDPALRLGEDYDLWLRVAWVYEVACVDRVLVRYRVHAQNATRRVDELYRSILTVLERTRRRCGLCGPWQACRFRAAMAHHRFEHGREWLDAGDERRAAALFWASWLTAPWRLRAAGYALACCVPGGVRLGVWLKRMVAGRGATEAPLPSQEAYPVGASVGAAAPHVSVVIPTHNTPPAYLRAAIDSALAQTYRPLEILVVDDGSTEPMEWLAQTYGDRVTVIRQSNQGTGKARNTGLQAARGPYVAFLDGDDLWDPQKLAWQVPLLEHDPSTALVYTRMRRVDGDGRPLPGPPHHPMPAGRVFRQVFERNVIPVSSVLARKACVDAVGGFDERRELMPVADYHLWIRLAERYAVACVDAPLLTYRVHGRAMSRHVDRAYNTERLVLEDAIRRYGARYPELRRRRRPRLARSFFEHGLDLLEEGRVAEAHRRFVESWRRAPWAPRTWLYVLTTGFGRPGVSAARAVKHGSNPLFSHPWRRKGRSLKKGAAPISVMHVLNTLDMGGAELVALSLARQLDRADFAVQVCSLSEEGALAPEFRALGMPVHALRRRPGVDLRLPLALARLIRAEHIGVVHTHNAAPWFYGGLAAKLAGVRLCHTEHSNLFPHQRRMQYLERWLARWTDVIIADSEKVKRHLVEQQGIPAAKIQTVLNGIDAHRFGTGSDPAAARQAMGLNGARPIIGTVGRLVPVKDHRTLLAAFRRVAEAYPDSRLVLVGDGPMREELERAASSLGLDGRVAFLGERGDVERLLPAFDLFALSSISEGMPLTILEAMAAGVPVVATRVGGVPEAVADRETGWLVPPRDPEGMAEAMLALLADPARRAALAQKAQQRVRTQFDVRQMADAYARAYHH